MAKGRSKRKIVKIEDIAWDPKDFVIYPKIGKYELRAKYANRKVETSFEDNLRSTAKAKNTCIKCHNQATKLVYLEIKGGGSQLERYCPSCFDRLVDIDKMELVSDDSTILEKIIIKPSEGQSRYVEEWRLMVKKGAHF